MQEVDTDDVGVEMTTRMINEKESEQTGTASMASTIFNFVNTVVGSGIIGLPYGLNQAGLFLGVFELILFAILTDYSISLLVQAGMKSGHAGYQALCRHTFGTVRVW